MEELMDGNMKTAELPKIDIQGFLETINRSVVQELPTEFDETAVMAAKKQLQETGIFLMGETHGVKENPDIIYTLMKRLGCRGLALEWDEKFTPIIERYLQTGELTLNRLMEMQINGGMVTAGHFALLQRLKNEGMLDKLILLESGYSLEAEEAGKGAEERDKNMATNLLTHIDSSIPTLVVTGSIHTNTEVTDGDGNWKAKIPMGAHLKEHFPSTRTGKIHYQEGSYFNGEIKQFETDSVIEPNPSFVLDTNGDYKYNLPEAHPAVVVRQLS